MLKRDSSGTVNLFKKLKHCVSSSVFEISTGVYNHLDSSCILQWLFQHEVSMEKVHFTEGFILDYSLAHADATNLTIFWSPTLKL